jgi:DNA polymerase elongation subunit (family B)
MIVAYLDIETSPALSYHFGMRNIFISPDQVVERTRVLCFAVRWEIDGKRERRTQFFSEWDGHDVAQELFNVYDRADIVVHYNGKRFDTPHARREMEEHGTGVPSPFLEIDLWVETKSRFAFMTSKLQSLVTELDNATKIKHTGIDLWISVLRGDVKAQRLMRRYNIHDVDLMVDVFPRLLPWIKVPNYGLVDAEPGAGGIDENVVCPRCNKSSTLERRGKVALSTGTYQAYRCTKDGGWVRGTKRIDSVQVVTLQ